MLLIVSIDHKAEPNLASGTPNCCALYSRNCAGEKVRTICVLNTLKRNDCFTQMPAYPSVVES